VSALLLEDVLVEVEPADRVGLVSWLVLLPDPRKDLLRFVPFLEKRNDLVDFVGNDVPVLVLVQSLPGLLLLGSVGHVVLVDRLPFGLFLRSGGFFLDCGLKLDLRLNLPGSFTVG
jgi:hypothetical protein